MVSKNETETENLIKTLKNVEHGIQEETKEKNLKVGQRVGFNLKLNEQSDPEAILYGIVKWISLNGKIIGVEFDETVSEPYYCGLQPYSSEFFDCTPNRTRILLGTDIILSPSTEPNGIVDNLINTWSAKGIGCVKNGWVYHDRENDRIGKKSAVKDASNQKSANIPEVIPPPNMSQIVKEHNRGMEWQANSCYLDATLFSMFYATDLFDKTLLGNTTQKDPTNKLSQQVMSILRNEIVYPLRTNLRCSGSNTAKLRNALKHLSDRIQCQFMDAEDFLFLLLERSLNIQEFLTYTTGVSDFIHQIIIDNDDPRKIGFVQDLLETSMRLNDGLKLDGIPNPAFLVEMPRSNGSLVKFNAVVPNLTINLTKFLSEASCICGKDGTWFCLQCTEEYKARCQLRCRWVSFCEDAKNQHIISHKNHQMLPAGMLNKGISVEMDLLAVICIRAVHYTTFVKCGRERFAPWLHFNSSDKAKPLKGMGEWLDKIERTPANNVENFLQACPEELRRIALDCHICIYQPKG